MNSNSVSSFLYLGHIGKIAISLYLLVPHPLEEPTSGFGSSCLPHVELTWGVILAAPATPACQVFAQPFVNSAKLGNEAWYL